MKIVYLIPLLFSLLLPPFQEEETDQSAAWLTHFDALVKAKDTKAMPAAIDALMNLKLGGKIPEKEYKEFCSRLSKAYGTKRNAVQVKAVYALGSFGKLGAKDLQRVLKDRSLKADEKREVFLAAIQGLGITKDIGGMKVLIKFLQDKDSYVIATAAESLGNYHDVKGVVRKEIVKNMIKVFSSSFSASKDARKTAQIEKFNVIAGPFNNTLQALTSASPGNAEDWQRWFNDNKKKKW